MPSLDSIDANAVNKFLGKLTIENICSSLLILIICIILIKLVTRLLRRILKHTPLDDRLKKFLLTGVRVVLYVITVIIVAQSLGVPTTSLIALMSVGALAVSLAVQGMLSNVAGGMMLLTSRPITLGDYVEVAGVSGFVNEIGILYTKLDGIDGESIMIPNSSISGERITNYTALGRRRIALSIGASYDAAIEDVRKALNDAIAHTDGLLKEPTSEVRVNAYLDSAVEYHVYAWCPAENYRVLRQVLTEEVKIAFDQYGIEIPYNHLNVHIMNDSTLRVEK